MKKVYVVRVKCTPEGQHTRTAVTARDFEKGYCSGARISGAQAHYGRSSHIDVECELSERRQRNPQRACA